MRKTFLTILCASLCLVAVAQDISAILQSIEQNNLQLQAMRHDNAATMLDAEAGNSILGGTSVEYSPFYRKGVSGMESSELIVSQEVTFPSAHIAQKRHNNAMQQVLDIEYQILRRDILLSAEDLCYDLMYALGTQQLLAWRSNVADSLLSAYTRRLDLGDATILDVNRIRMDRMSLLTDVAQCNAQVQALHVQLQALNGGVDVDDSPLLTCSGINATSVLSPSLSEATARIVPLSSQLAQAVSQAQDQEISVARNGFMPNLTIGYRRNTELREVSNGFLVGVSVPLFANGKKVRAARLRQSAAQDQLQNAQLETESSIKSLQAEVSQFQSSLDAFDLSLMNHTLSLLRQALLAGQISVIEYYTEADQIYDRMLQYLDLRTRLLKAKARLRTL